MALVSDYHLKGLLLLKALRPRLVSLWPFAFKPLRCRLVGAAKQATSDSMALVIPEGGLCLSSFKNKACSPEGAKKTLHNRFVCAAQQAGLCGPEGHLPLEPEGGGMALMNIMLTSPLYVKFFNFFSYV